MYKLSVLLLCFVLCACATGTQSPSRRKNSVPTFQPVPPSPIPWKHFLSLVAGNPDTDSGGLSDKDGKILSFHIFTDPDPDCPIRIQTWYEDVEYIMPRQCHAAGDTIDMNRINGLHSDLFVIWIQVTSSNSIAIFYDGTIWTPVSGL